MNVFEATQERLARIFADFDNVYVSFSGGKDSGVMLNMAADYCRKHYPGRKLGVFHIDYEAQYQMTTDYVDETLKDPLFEVYRVCLPMAVPCATSMHQPYWIPWDADLKDIWVRPMPENCINESNHKFQWFKKGMWDYDLQERFSNWLHQHKKANKTACLVGIRTQESLNRWRAINSDRNQNKYEGLEWSTQMRSDVYNFYPIFDWTTEDVWTANGKLGFTYNRLYDLFHMAGVSIDMMRVASPFNDHAISSLKLYKVIDPNNWGRMIGRVNGVNFSGLYGGTTAMGWRDIKLPPGHTWQSYMEFLLTTLPKEAADNYRKKLEFSREFWRTKGGCLGFDTIKKLEEQGVKFTVGEMTNRKTEKPPVRMEYVDDIDIPEFQQIPSFKRMCVCIMKNDHLCKYMGFAATKTESQRRAEAENKYRGMK